MVRDTVRQRGVSRTDLDDARTRQGDVTREGIRIVARSREDGATRTDEGQVTRALDTTEVRAVVRIGVDIQVAI